MNITEPIRRTARVRPDAIAVVRADGSGVSYRDFDGMIDAVATRLAGLGVVAGQTIGLAIGGPDEFLPLVAALALARLGAASADTALPPSRMDFCLLPHGAADVPGICCLRFDAAWARAPAPNAIVPYSDGGAACRVFASSGTTGVPKFAAITHDTLAKRVFSTWLSMGPPEAVHICAVSLGISWGFGSMLRTFWGGATLVLTNPADAVASIRRHRVNSMVIAPISLQKVVTAMPDGAGPLPSMKVVEVGGSGLPASLLDIVRRRFCGNVVSHYGTMETGSVASAPMSALPGGGQAVGTVHAGVEVQAVDADDRPLPPSTEGILRIRSDHAIAAYIDAPAVRDGWFYTSDVGAVTRDGLMTVAGRREEFINSGGNKLSPHVVEEVLLSLPHVTDAAAFGVPDSMGVVQIWAAIVAAERIETAVLKAHCHARLAEKSPKFILQVKGLPRNANGKLLRDELIKFAMTQQR